MTAIVFGLTNAYAAKRELMARLLAMTGTGLRLDGVQVAYSHPGPLTTDRCVYGGGVRFTQDDDATAGADDTLKLETATIGLVIRVVRDAADGAQQAADADAEALAGIIAVELARDPALGEAVYSRISGGIGDYAPSDGRVTAILALLVDVISYVSTQ